MFVCRAPVSSLDPFYRYWGSDVSNQATSTVSVASLHRLARRRAAARQTLSQERRQVETASSPEDDGEVEDERPLSDGGLDCSVAMEAGSVETGQELPQVTHSLKSSLAGVVHARLPAWITQPRLVDVDIVSGSVPLTSVPLPAIISSNLQTMGCTSLFPVQVMIVAHDEEEVILLPPRQR